ncbi:phosphatase PAP2 family protein [Candidatus Parcubacteria bacterium]|nr:MAG: phosphatase PAP2 family protein [Candidatus Parcubacteria bacterium]
MDAIISLDQYILEGLYAMRNPEAVQVLIWITELGSTTFIGGLTISAGLVFLFRGKVAYFTGLAISVAGSAAAVYFLKELFHRARPDTIFQAYLETGFSFPSGHAAMSLALYGFLVWLVWRHIPQTGWRFAALFSAALLIGVIGFSRMYLGVHHASDVLGGFLIAGMFAWLATIATRKMLSLTGSE